MLHGIDMNKDNMIDFAEFCTLVSGFSSDSL